MMGRLVGLVALAMLLLPGTGPVAEAAVVGEGVILLRCSEGSDLSLPKKAELVQILSAEDFAEHDRVTLFIECEFAEERIEKGKLIATVFQVSDDGSSETRVGKLTVRMSQGEGVAQKTLGLSLAPGDELLWKLKLRGMPALSADLEDCFSAIFMVAVADDFP